jgi:hypothetical protein
MIKWIITTRAAERDKIISLGISKTRMLCKTSDLRPPESCKKWRCLFEGLKNAFWYCFATSSVSSRPSYQDDWEKRSEDLTATEPD